jgi:hypothetical protein
MSNEARIQTSLNIQKSSGTIQQLDYRSSPNSYQVDVTGAKGPTPGAMSASVAGTDVDFSQLTQPTLCLLHNQDGTNFVEYGVWDPEGSKFYPLGELGPGEVHVLKLSRNLQEEYGTGTGTTGANTNRLRLKADTAACNVFVGAFEK